MIIKNTTNFSDQYISQMLGWICKELKFAKKRIKKVTCRNTCINLSGLADIENYEIILRIGPEHLFPAKFEEGLFLTDRYEGMIFVAAHEIRHLDQKGIRYIEKDANKKAEEILDKFIENKEELIGQWSV